MILTLKEPTPVDVNMSAITPDLLKRDINAVHNLPLTVGVEQVALGDLFSVAVDNEERIVIRKAHRCLSHVGARMTDGEMLVEGDCGDHTARAMRGGSVRITGDAGACAAAQMSGGRLFIGKNAGDALGGAPVGARRGISGGDVIVGGNVGARACERMRRGVVVILGDCGDFCAAHMIAGTVFVLGKTGRDVGYEMRRGTVLVKDRSGISDAFFAHSGAQTNFMPLLVRYVRGLDKSTRNVPESYTERRIGDLSVGGLGEIIVL